MSKCFYWSNKNVSEPNLSALEAPSFTCYFIVIFCVIFSVWKRYCPQLCAVDQGGYQVINTYGLSLQTSNKSTIPFYLMSNYLLSFYDNITDFINVIDCQSFFCFSLNWITSHFLLLKNSHYLRILFDAISGPFYLKRSSIFTMKLNFLHCWLWTDGVLIELRMPVGVFATHTSSCLYVHSHICIMEICTSMAVMNKQYFIVYS